MTTPSNGDTVTIDYVLKRGDGQEIGNTSEVGPQTVQLGAGQIFPAIEEALTGMEVGDIDLYELNEAFASVPMLMMHLLGIPHEKMNVNGGAIAFGHPLGATGGMLLGTMVDELERSDKETALVTLCVGAGMGTATIIERV